MSGRTGFQIFKHIEQVGDPFFALRWRQGIQSLKMVSKMFKVFAVGGTLVQDGVYVLLQVFQYPEPLQVKAGGILKGFFKPPDGFLYADIGIHLLLLDGLKV